MVQQDNCHSKRYRMAAINKQHPNMSATVLSSSTSYTYYIKISLIITAPLQQQWQIILSRNLA